MDDAEWGILIRLTRVNLGEVERLYEGELRPGSVVELTDGLTLEALWIRKSLRSTTPAESE